MSLAIPPTPALSTSTTPLNGPSSEVATPQTEVICTQLHPLWCIDVLVSHFEGRKLVTPPFSNVNDRYALFVSWHTIKPGRKHRLRGCIGNFSPMKLSEGLKEYALASAFKDHRFSPIRASELPSMSCEVSLLTPLIPISDPLDWTPGIHGIHITFPHPSGHSQVYSATYLPHVCPEQGWTREETVLSAISKAGFRGKVVVGDKVWQSLKVKIYGSVKEPVTWQDYVEWKEMRREPIVITKN
ncbi:uncharacterized protein L203_101508 [Cryptococcus depauperatus CBS 7841]|uniref:Uncharacterized protein n=1 Tax=Cryptococcus depauperatus CBS 7841 TaxID=1295531 RepID=A0A1E3IVE1_9TREE|nr:AMME syndrome candidate protein [Cryptococcus depauperatus CBS 7841]